ncbi:MAG TPA: hypothetical protein VN540_01750 [Clostridia bacterium]|nr:hypothetical protein [Clostridia bacterium]
MNENNERSAQEKAGAGLLNAQARKNYGGKCDVNGSKLPCYTVRQIRSMYPDKDFGRAAEYAPGVKDGRIGAMKVGKSRISLMKYGANSRLVYRETGYVAVEGEDAFVVLLKNVLLRRVLALALCLALAAGGAIFLPKLLGAPGTEELGGGAEAAASPAMPELEEGAVDWEGTKAQDTGGVVPGIAIPGYKSITVAANATDVQVNFQNPEGNPCYFEISLLLADGTELYKSKMIEPGKGLYEIALGRALAPGEYDAVVKYDTYSLTDLTPMNGAEVQIKLIAQ